MRLQDLWPFSLLYERGFSAGYDCGVDACREVYAERIARVEELIKRLEHEKLKAEVLNLGK